MKKRALILFTVLLLSYSTSLHAQKKKVFNYNEFSALYNKKDDENEALKQFRQMEALRENAQVSLARLAKRSPENLEVQLRLGELYLQRARDLEQFSLELDSFGKHKEAKKYHSKIKPLYNKGLALQTRFLPKLKGHPLESSVYFGIARTQSSLGEKNAALLTLERALKIKKIPSNVLLQLWMLKGDVAFTSSKGAIALQAYSKVAELVEPGTLEDIYVSYRLGWSVFNLKDPNTALLHMKKVLDDRNNRYQIKDEAVKDYALFAADLSKTSYDKEGGVAGIYSYLKKSTNAEQAFNAIVYMGKVFEKNGSRKRAIEAYEYLLSEQKENSSNAELALTIVEWSKSLIDQSKMKDRFVWLLDNYGPHSSWYESQIASPNIQKNSSDAIESALREHAVKLHKKINEETSKERKQLLYAVVAQLYDAHIKAFTSQSRIYYYRAEIYRDLKQYSDAGRSYDKYNHYLELLETDGLLSDLDKKLSYNAAVGAVEVWAKAVEKDKVHAKDFLNSSDLFLKKFPKKKIASQIAYDASKIELEAGNSTLALSRIQFLVDNYPKKSVTVKAVHAALDILNNENDYVNLAFKARAWLDSIKKWAPASSLVKAKQELKAILSKTEAKACESLGENKNRKLEAAICYQRFAKGFSKDPLAPKALLLSSELFEQWGDNVSSLESLEILVKSYPKSKQAIGAFSKLATSYEKTFQFQEASEIYEQLLSRKDFKESKKVLERLLMVLQGLDQKKRLDQWLSKKMVSKPLKQSILRKELFEQMMSLRFEERKFGYNKTGLVSKKANSLYKQLEKSEKKGDLSLDLSLELTRIEGSVHKAKGNLSAADRVWMAGLKRFWKTSKKYPELWESAARLRLAQGSYWKHMFDKVSLVKNAQKKLELFQKLEAWYAEVINMKAPAVALESLWETAKLYDEFSAELMTLEQTKSQAEEMQKSSKLLLKKLAESANKWKVFSPVLLAALNKLKGNKNTSDLSTLEFPWPSLPPFLELSTKEMSWKQWDQSTSTLNNVLKQKEAARSAQKRAAFVALLRKQSLEDKNLSRWADLLNQKNGVQLRIQALINDANYRKAELFLSQYEELFGADHFYKYHIAENAWSRGNYALAYKVWSAGMTENSFQSVYTAAGWAVLLEELVEDVVTESTSKKIFSNLYKSADDLWKKQYLAHLCLASYIQCKPSNEYNIIIGSLKQDNPSYLVSEVNPTTSVQFLRHRSLELFAANKIAEISSMDDALKLRSTLNDLKFFAYKVKGKLRKDAVAEYNKLKSLLNKAEVRVSLQEAKRDVAKVKEQN